MPPPPQSVTPRRPFWIDFPTNRPFADLWLIWVNDLTRRPVTHAHALTPNRTI
jgi:hypothetical protein